MPIHAEVLEAALRICRERGGWTFTANEIVQSLPHLNERSVRTHIVSRCCVNAPKNHPHKWDYFRRVRRGTYEIRPPFRLLPAPRPGARRRHGKAPPTAVSEGGATYGSSGADSAAPRDTIHVSVHKSAGYYVAEGLEVAVVTQGRTLDELLSNLREAVGLHLEGEDLARLGLAPAPRLAVIYEMTSATDARKA